MLLAMASRAAVRGPRAGGAPPGLAGGPVLVRSCRPGRENTQVRLLRSPKLHDRGPSRGYTGIYQPAVNLGARRAPGQVLARGLRIELGYFVTVRVLAASPHNGIMVSLSVYTAVIAGAAGVGGAAIPAITSLIHDMVKTKRDRGERKDSNRDQACLDLLRSAKKLRSRVADAAQYHGPEMRARLEEIRSCESEVMLYSAKVELLTTEKIRALAASLADVARQLTTLVEQNTNMQVGEIDPKPDLNALEESINGFREVVVGDSSKR